MRSRTRLLALALAVAFAGCGDDDKPATMKPTPATPNPTPGTPNPTPAPGGPIPITAWVHSLVNDYGPTSAPDTVDDKNLTDTEDPAAFDPLLQP